MYNVKRKNFIITEIVHMNASVSSEKEKVKESQSRSVTSPLDTPSGAGLGASQKEEMTNPLPSDRKSAGNSTVTSQPSSLE